MPATLVLLEILDVQPHEKGALLFFTTSKKEKITKLEIDGSIGYSISLALHKERAVRPLTHDVFMQALMAFGAEIKKVSITDVVNGMFLTTIRLEAENEIMNRKVVDLEVRPGDAIAMALRCRAPIYAHQDVWQKWNDDSCLYELLCENGTDRLLS